MSENICWQSCPAILTLDIPDILCSELAHFAWPQGARPGLALPSLYRTTSVAPPCGSLHDAAGAAERG